jgi:hypothetical protein
LETLFEARKLDDEARIAIDNQRRRLILTGHAYSIVAEAGQIYRAPANSDQGIDGEIEFVDNQGQPSGKRLYLQFQSGDPDPGRRGHDTPERLLVTSTQWVNYWQEQQYTLMLVMQTSDTDIRWMDVSGYLKSESARGREVKEIAFEGELFDAKSVSAWRRRMLEEV